MLSLSHSSIFPPCYHFTVQSFLIFPTKTNRLLQNTRVVRHKIAGESDQQTSPQVMRKVALHCILSM